MEKISPYITGDIHLEHMPEFKGFPGTSDAGYYNVFWWRDIPLGQLFIEKDQALTREEDLQKIFDVIAPTIDFYIGRQKLTKPDYKNAFFDEDQQEFGRQMDQIFGFLANVISGKGGCFSSDMYRNRSISLKNCLDRLKKQQSLPSEIIVVDNAPTDESTRLVAEQYPEVTYFKEPRPGLDIARNAGAKLAKCSVVAYVDDDVLVHPLWVYRTWESFLSEDVEATTGLVIASSLETEAQQIFEKFWSFNRGYEDKVYDSEFFNENLTDGPPVWEIGAGANMAFRKSLFDKVGYFDPRLDVGAAGCSGDSEMWFRILANGGAIHYCPRSVVYHEHRKELPNLQKQLFFYMRGFAAAALIQQEYHKKAGYKNRLFKQLPKSYLQMLVSAFPRYSFQNRTLLSEIRGVISGIRFYNKNKKNLLNKFLTLMMISSSTIESPLVSIIIPCYNHGKYLAKSIESVLAQSYKHYEIIVVDDGSTDNTRSVAEFYETVNYIYKTNAGLSAARNTGIDNSTGNFLLFLDADDWLFEDALSINLYYLCKNPAAAFVSGAFTDVFMHHGYQVKSVIKKDHYLYLLERNYIAMHATVMYRRWAFDDVRYDSSLKACEDYDIYLRIARKYPVLHHTKQVAAYIRHDTNMSGNYPMMLEYALLVLNRQKDVLDNEVEKEYFQKGLQFWIDHYCINIYANLSKGTDSDNIRLRSEVDTLKQYRKDLYLKYNITKPFMQLKKSLIKSNLNFLLKLMHKAGLYKKFIPAPGKIAMGDFDRITPFSNAFGYDRGGPVDRYYIENFLKKQSSTISGRVLEIGDNEYTLKFGGSNVKVSDVLHVDESAQATFTGDLSNAPQIPSDSFDCIVLTQTLHLIYDYKAALQTCYRVLKPGGILLLTVPGISHIDQGEWKKIWLYSFTESSITKILSEIFPVDKIEVETFGNVLVAAAFLFGIGLPELKTEQMDFNDPHYQVIITATAVKPS